MSLLPKVVGMAGLDCDCCFEETRVIPSGELLDDAAGRTVYRRWRVCVQVGCELYLLRRASFEVLAPMTGTVKVIPPYNHMIAHLNLPARTAPPPPDPERPPS